MHTNNFRKQNEKEFADMLDLTRIERNMDQIKLQKRQVIESLAHYKGGEAVSVSRVSDQELGSFLQVKERSGDILRLVDDRELNQLKKRNYGDSYGHPSHFNEKIKKMEQEIRNADQRFTRESPAKRAARKA